MIGPRYSNSPKTVDASGSGHAIGSNSHASENNWREIYRFPYKFIVDAIAMKEFQLQRN